MKCIVPLYLLLAIAPVTNAALPFASTKTLPGGMRFSEYSGADFADWDVAQGSLADTTYKLPVYRGWPNKPYRVIGDIRHKDPRRNWNEGEIKDAVKGAKQKGGDAIIVRWGSEGGVFKIVGGQRHNVVGTRAGETALVIRWLTDEEIRDRKNRDAAYFKRLAATDPNISVSEDTTKLATKYLLQQGAKEDSPEFFDRLLDLGRRINPAQKDSLAGDWLFKANIKTTGIVRSEDQKFMGLATVSVSESAITIVSIDGGTEFNFSGKRTADVISGNIGIAGNSAKAEGVALPKKISLTYRSLTQDGTTQGSVILQR